MPKGKEKLTKDQVQEKLDKRYPNTYKLVGEYLGRNERILVEHVSCGKTFETTYHSIYSSNHQICPNCKTERNRERRGITLENYNNKLLSIPNGEEYKICQILFSEKGSKLEIIHKLCGTKFITTHTCFFIKGTRCPTCSIKRRSEATMKSTDEFKNEIEKIYNNSITVLDDYKGSKIKIRFQCNKCNLIFSTRPNTLLNKYKRQKIANSACPKCARQQGAIVLRKNPDDFKNFVEKDGNFKLLSTYKNDRSKVEIKCLSCGTIFSKIASVWVQKQSCPECNRYLGEKMIKEFLEEMNITFETQKNITIDDHNLKYDFFIPKLNVAIEYDGEFHYHWVKKLVKKEEFIKQKKYDRLKNKYSLENNIKLYRIPYWQRDNVRNIVNSIISSLDESNNYLVESIYNVQRLSKAYYLCK